MSPARSTSNPTGRERLVRRRIGSVEWILRASAEGEALREVLRDPESALASAAHVFKDSRVVRIVRLPPLQPGQPNLVLRCLKYGKGIHQLRDFFRISRAERALRLGWRLEQAGIPTPRVLAAATIRRARWPVRAYLVTEEVPAALTLPALFQQRKRRFPREVIPRLGRLLGRLHAHGFSHSDLKATNLLVDGGLEPWFIDMDGIHRRRKLSDAQAIEDLLLPARYAKPVLRLTRTARALFLKHYCAARRRHHWRWWWRALEEKQKELRQKG